NICKSINSLRTSSSYGVDGIASIYFKLGGPNLPLILLKLFDLSLTTGSYPNRWKTSYICPRFKSGDRTNLHNYRPINITPVISRIMEKIVCYQMSDYFLSEKLIFNSQHGFLKTRSCMACHFEFFNLVFTKRSLGHLVLVLYLDISKAFDMVNHKLLVGKLSSYGIRNPLLAWLNSFLSNRHQIVKINSTLSKAEPVTSGVIQGSVLGPFLFIACTNDICKCFSMGRPFLYADDLKIVYSFPPHEFAHTFSGVTTELNKVAVWCSKWKLDLNASKCGWICFGDERLNFDLSINGSKLSRLQSVVDLGLRYSYNLSFTEQVNMQTFKSHRLLGCILRNFYSNDSRILLYKVCVRPLLVYCTFILRDKLRLESVQRRFTLRILEADRTLNYKTRCTNLELDTLWRRRLKLNLIFFCKILDKLAFSSPNTIQFEEPSCYNLRNSASKIKISHSTSALYMNYFTNKFSRIWNHLPQPIRDTDSLLSFVRHVSNFISSEISLKMFTPTIVSYSTSEIIGTLNV
ncbi:hypothetical protein MN116_000480, partial [Schistosoma mekongi]